MENAEVIEYLKDSFELKRQGMYKQAMELLYKALTECPDNVEILAQVADLHILLNNPASAGAILERLFVNKPDDIDVLDKLSDYYINSFNFDKAKVVLSKFVLAYPDEKAYELYLRKYFKMNDFDKILDFYKEKNLQSINSLSINKIYGMTLCKFKKYNEAKLIFDELYEKLTHDDEFLYYYAQTLYSLGKIDEAYSIVSELVKRTNFSDVYNLCGEIFLGQEKYEQAIDLFSTAVKLKSDGLYFYNLATAYFMNGQLNEAKNFYTKAVSLSPEIKEYKYALAHLHFELGESGKAERILKELLKIYPDFKEAVLLNVEILLKEGKFYQAEKLINEFEFSDKYEDEDYLKYSADICQALYKKEQARDLLKKYTAIKTDAIDELYSLSRLEFELDDTEEAKKLAYDLLSKSPKYVNAYLLLGKIFRKEGDCAKVIEMADKVLSFDLNNEEALRLKAFGYVSLQDFQNAVITLKTLLNYNPNLIEAYSLMGACYASLDEFETAKKYYLEAVTLEPKNADCFMNLAVLEQKLGNENASARYLYIAHSLKPDNREITEKLADAYIDAKRYKLAIKLLSKQLKEERDISLKSEIAEKIKETENLYKKSVNPVRYIIWRIFRI